MLAVFGSLVAERQIDIFGVFLKSEASAWQHPTSVFMAPKAQRPTPFQLIAKRVFDFVLALLLLLTTSPLLLAISLTVRTRMGSPVFYRQLRPGRDGQPIGVWKFRTMTLERDEHGQLLSDGQRLTKIGRFLREHSLDELPQLLNILTGQMSFVGPRPLLIRYLPRYTERQLLRHAMKPGITGYAQIQGRNALDWDSRLDLDVWYVENFSLRLDFWIILRTIRSVMRGEGVLAGAGAELDEFWGTEGPPATGPRAFPVEAAESLPKSFSTNNRETVDER